MYTRRLRTVARAAWGGGGAPETALLGENAWRETLQEGLGVVPAG